MATEFPLPSPLAAAPQLFVQETLPARINAASRKQHTELNRLIVQRLALALPPHAKHPSLYAKGLVTFAQIFFQFEEEWALLTERFLSTSNIKDLTPEERHAYDVQGWLAGLRSAALSRSERLQQDLKHLEQVSGKGIYDTASLHEDAWSVQMRLRMRTHPHIFVAYAWVMYMAVFSGGRFIRQELANAGPEFWSGTKQVVAVPSILDLSKEEKGEKHSEQAVDLPGFSFLSFDSTDDGAAIKVGFKSGLLAAETLLTAQEKKEVIDVATQIFDRCVFLVHDLDQTLARQSFKNYANSILAVLIMLGLLALVNVY